jgi:hypothetical protein
VKREELFKEIRDWNRRYEALVVEHPLTKYGWKMTGGPLGVFVTVNGAHFTIEEMPLPTTGFLIHPEVHRP